MWATRKMLFWCVIIEEVDTPRDVKPAASLLLTTSAIWTKPQDPLCLGVYSNLHEASASPPLISGLFCQRHRLVAQWNTSSSWWEKRRVMVAAGVLQLHSCMSLQMLEISYYAITSSFHLLIKLPGTFCTLFLSFIKYGWQNEERIRCWLFSS